MSTTTKKNKITSLKFYKLNEQAQLPVFSTDQSACFDLFANLVLNETVHIIKQFQQNSYPEGFLLI